MGTAVRGLFISIKNLIVILEPGLMTPMFEATRIHGYHGFMLLNIYNELASKLQTTH